MSKIIKEYLLNDKYYDAVTEKIKNKEIDIVTNGCEEKLEELFNEIEKAAMWYSLGSKKNAIPYIFKKEIYPEEGRLKITAELNAAEKEGQEDIFSFNIYYCGLDEKGIERYTIFEDWIYSIDDKLNHIPLVMSHRGVLIAEILYKLEKKTEEYISCNLMKKDDKGIILTMWYGKIE